MTLGNLLGSGETRDETPKYPRMVCLLLIVLQFKRLLHRLKASNTSWKTKVTTMLKSFYIDCFIERIDTHPRLYLEFPGNKCLNGSASPLLYTLSR